MSYASRPLPSHMRQPSSSGNSNSASAGQSPILLARINEKKAELENLKQLRDLSAGLAGQMQMLEEKLATLSDGTEVKIPKPKDTEESGSDETQKKDEAEGQGQLPQTLVRIPTEHAPMLQQQVGGSGGSGE
ncbi:hypothetical protein LARI1_G004314 [Lachnellula arida]|uniref:DASH complex subunit DAD2 n=1 Tax=Lachnellula arida TaxID=1316785 RepID=A0A8T9BCS2_9HELO|nr:hypothetical protein LARI1_G004314 [Lachnellula arida]